MDQGSDLEHAGFSLHQTFVGLVYDKLPAEFPVNESISIQEAKMEDIAEIKEMIASG